MKFITKLANRMFSVSSPGFAGFVAKMFTPNEKTADEIISSRPDGTVFSPLHAMEHRVLRDLFSAYCSYELYDMMRIILENNGLDKYFHHPYVADVKYGNTNNSLIIVWDSNTNDQTFYKITLGIFAEPCPGYASTKYNVNIQYQDRNTNVAWGSGEVSYLDAISSDLTDYQKVFEQVKPIDRTALQRNQKTGLYEEIN